MVDLLIHPQEEIVHELQFLWVILVFEVDINRYMETSIPTFLYFIRRLFQYYKTKDKLYLESKAWQVT